MLSWNIGHGLDEPPDSALLTWRSRLLRVTEMNATHAQVNRPLRPEFGSLLASYEWDVALLQEAPPSWCDTLARAAHATSAASALTARNVAAPLRRWLAARNPDLIGSHEGGSNQMLTRAPWRIVEIRRLTLTQQPERRRMLWVRLRGPGGVPLAVANVHLSAWDSAKAGREAVRAAAQAITWADQDPLVFGGDLNAPDTFGELRERFGLVPQPAPETIEHLLGRGLEVVEAPCALPPGARELPGFSGRYGDRFRERGVRMASAISPYIRARERQRPDLALASARCVRSRSCGNRPRESRFRPAPTSGSYWVTCLPRHFERERRPRKRSALQLKNGIVGTVMLPPELLRIVIVTEYVN